MYTQQMPPFDGFYTITNNSGGWSEIFDTWLQTRDSSTDPNGYFMVVNASFSPGVFYEQEISGLCENTQYEFSADIINMIQSGVANHILPNVAFFLNGVEQFNTGDIPQNNQWITFGFTFITSPGQTDISLTLRNNAPGGTGNDLGLDNIRFRACGPLAFIHPSEKTELCKNDPVIELNAMIEEEQEIFDKLQWQVSTDMGMSWNNLNMATGMNYTHDSNEVGTYQYRYLLATSLENLENSKCRIQSDVAEIVIVPEEFSVADTICEGNSLEIDGQILSEPGDYVLNLISQAGCDSIVFLTLETVENISEDAEFFTHDPACFGEASGKIELLDYVDSRLPYQVKMNGVDVEIEKIRDEFYASTIENLPAGNYEFDIMDKYGCQTFVNFTLTDPPKIEVNAGPDQDLILGETIILNANTSEPFGEINWSPATGLSCSDCLTPELLAINDQAYILSVINESGCEQKDSVLVKVDDYRAVYIPNAFSPNGDGINENFRFYAIGKSILNIKTWLIFDRFGTPVFTGSELNPLDPTIGWDGKFNAKKLNPGVYIYFFELEFLDGEIGRYRGNLTLVR
jgi:gliding motility-associated-like protein